MRLYRLLRLHRIAISSLLSMLPPLSLFILRWLGPLNLVALFIKLPLLCNTLLLFIILILHSRSFVMSLTLRHRGLIPVLPLWLIKLFVNLLLRPRELLITFLMCPLSRLPRLFECRLLCLACLLRQENFQARATLIESQTPRWQQVHTIYRDLNRHLTQQTGQITPDPHPRSQSPSSSLYEPRPGSRD
jgi:hypothetical protein